MRRNYKIIPLLVAAFGLSACGPDASEYEKVSSHAAALEAEAGALRKEVASLKAELEEIKFGAEKLLAKAESEIEADNLLGAKASLTQLIKRHPDSGESSKAALLLAEVQRKIDQKAREELAARERAEKNLKREEDEVEGITWLSHKGSPILGKYMKLYFGTKGGDASQYPLRVKMQYSDDSWLFVRSLTIKADETNFEIGPVEFKRDNSSGTIWEWMDVPVSDFKMLAKILTAKRVVIRFHGDKYYSDFVVPKSQQLQMQEIYAAWKARGGKE